MGKPGVGEAESEAVLSRILDYLQSNRYIRMVLGLALIGGMLFVAGRSVVRLIPRHHTLTVSGGDIVNNRHYLARLVQREAPAHNLTVIVEPSATSLIALEKVSNGKIDMAFIQGGLEAKYPNIEHVSTVLLEFVHLLVKPGVTGMGDLKGRSINMGAKNSAAREVALTLTQFAGYTENIDYVETNYVAEQLIALPAHKMPDAIVTVSSVPSYLVEYLVKTHHYNVVEIPFPESLALRHGWAANGTILGYTYDLNPPVPAKSIQTIAVNMHLVANSKVEPKAISAFLEILYSGSVSGRLLQPIDEKRITVPSGYPVSAGMEHYIHRNDSLLTMETWNQATGVFGLVMSFSGMGLVLIKWFKGKPPRMRYDDDEFIALLADVVKIEKEMLAMEVRGELVTGELRRLAGLLGELRIRLLERFPSAKLKDVMLFDRCVATVRASQEQINSLMARAA